MSWFDQGWGLSLTVFLPLVGVGMLLLIPKAHAATLDQMMPDDAGAMLRNLPALTRAVPALKSWSRIRLVRSSWAIPGTRKPVAVGSLIQATVSRVPASAT